METMLLLEIPGPFQLRRWRRQGQISSITWITSAWIAQVNVLSCLLIWFGLKLDIFGVDLESPAYGDPVCRLQQILVFQQIAQHNCSTNLTNQLVNCDYAGPWLKCLRKWVLWNLWTISQYGAHTPGLGRQWELSRSVQPPYLMPVHSARDLPVSAGAHRHMRKSSHMVAEEGESTCYEGLALPCDPGTRQVQGISPTPYQNPEVSVRTDLGVFMGNASGTKAQASPSLSLRYRAPTCTPLEATPPSSIRAPLDNRLSKASVPSAARDRIAIPSLYAKLKARLKHGQRTSAPRLYVTKDGCACVAPRQVAPKCKALKHDAVAPVTNCTSRARLSEHSPPSLKSAVTCFPLATAPSGTKCMPGGPPKRPRSDGNQQTHQSGSNTQRGNGGPSELPRWGGGDEFAGDEHGNNDEGGRGSTTSRSPGDKTSFRCPYYAAGLYECPPKCKDWHNPTMPSVTRHVLNHFKDDPQRTEQITRMSSQKLVARERWKQYFLICNDGVEDREMHQPYWLMSGGQESVQELASILPLGDSAASVAIVQGYQQLLARKEHQDRAIRARCEAAKAAAMATEQSELDESQRIFEQEVASFLSQDGTDATSSPVLVQPLENISYAYRPEVVQPNLSDFPPFQTPLRRTQSARPAYNEQIFGQDQPMIAPVMQHDDLMGMMPPNTEFLPDGSRQEIASMPPEAITQQIHATDLIMDPLTDVDTAQRLHMQQNARRNKLDMLHPSHFNRQKVFDSAVGTSVYTRTPATSSVGAPDERSMYSSDIGPRRMPWSPQANDKFMGYDPEHDAAWMARNADDHGGGA